LYAPHIKKHSEQPLLRASKPKMEVVVKRVSPKGGETTPLLTTHASHK